MPFRFGGVDVLADDCDLPENKRGRRIDRPPPDQEVRGLVALTAGLSGIDAEVGETLAKEAVAMAADTDDLNLLGYALSGFGSVLASARREPEASAAYAQAAEVFRRKGNVVAGARVEERANVLAIGT